MIYSLINKVIDIIDKVMDAGMSIAADFYDHWNEWYSGRD